MAKLRSDHTRPDTRSDVCTIQGLDSLIGELLGSRRSQGTLFASTATTVSLAAPFDITEMAPQVVILAHRRWRKTPAPPVRTIRTAPEAQAERDHQKSAWDVFDELWAELTDEELENLPPDLAAQHDHYIYGTPKKRG